MSISPRKMLSRQKTVLQVKTEMSSKMFPTETKMCVNERKCLQCGKKRDIIKNEFCKYLK